MKPVNLAKIALVILLSLIVLDSRSASAAEATSYPPGIEIELVNDTASDMILVGRSATAGTFPTAPPDDLAAKETSSFRIAPSGNDTDLLAFDLIYLIEDNGTFFEVSFTLAEDSRAVDGTSNYNSQTRGLAMDRYVAETSPPFDPTKRFQKLRTTFSKLIQDPLDTDFGITMTIYNETDFSMTLTDDDLEWGKWTSSPPSRIDSKDSATITATGRSGSWSGAEGYVEYSIDDANEPEFKIKFDAPYDGDGSFTISASGSGKSKYSYEYYGYDPEEDFPEVEVDIETESE